MITTQRRQLPAYLRTEQSGSSAVMKAKKWRLYSGLFALLKKRLSFTRG
jgi:hypothetical protein